MSKRPIQYFSQRSANPAPPALSHDEIARFLHEFQSIVQGKEGPRKLISLRVPEEILRHFKAKAKREGTLYQRKIVDLMRAWLIGPSPSVPEPTRLHARPRLIVSGGQTGVDRAALDVGRLLGIPIGGWCPKGRLALDGPIDPLYPLLETPSEKYAQRTEWNIRDSDFTLILTWGKPNGGTLLTLQVARRLNKPHLVTDLSSEPDRAIESTRGEISGLGPITLNIAGSRASKHPSIYPEAYKFLCGLFRPISPGPQS